MDKNIRVRFAPSPTGYLHIGGARTALFNYLFAKRHGGSFILRIEDTDEARSTDESIRAIIESMNWLGLRWDEGPSTENAADTVGTGEYGPYFQMSRIDIYKRTAERLIAEGKAYYCACSAEELKKMREEMTAKKLPPKYDGRCRDKNRQRRKPSEAGDGDCVVRFKMAQEGSVVFDDAIRGRLEFENRLLDDFVILKGSGVPTYNFACTVDDYMMRISHVIRGDDHLSNTPRQMHLYRALGWEPPVFAHLSMILGPDGARLSKRHGHTSVLEYRDDGYIPEALINYLALLGWGTQDSKQIFAAGELQKEFNLENCSKSPAVFDNQKLLWMNMEYLKKLDPAEILSRAAGIAEKAGVTITDADYARKILSVEKEKIKLLTDVPKILDIFFADKIVYDEAAVAKIFADAAAPQTLEAAARKLDNVDDFTKGALEKTVKDFCLSSGLKNAKVFHPLRVAVSGRMQGPGLFDLLELLGKKRALERISEFLKNH